MTDTGIFSTVIKAVLSPEQLDVKPEGTIDTIEQKPESKAIPPFTKYNEIKGHPYSVDHFGIKHWDALTPELDVNKLHDKVNSVEKFVGEEIKRRGYENNVNSYKEMIGRIESNLNVSPNEQSEKKLGRVVEYIKILKKQRNLDEERKKLYG